MIFFFSPTSRLEHADGNLFSSPLIDKLGCDDSFVPVSLTLNTIISTRHRHEPCWPAGFGTDQMQIISRRGLVKRKTCPISFRSYSDNIHYKCGFFSVDDYGCQCYVLRLWFAITSPCLLPSLFVNNGAHRPIRTSVSTPFSGLYI